MSRWIVLTLILILGAFVLSSCASMRYLGKPPLTKEQIINMSKAKVSDEVIIEQIKATGVHFRLSTDDIIALKEAGVSDKVVGAMIKSARWYESYQYNWFFDYSIIGLYPSVARPWFNAYLFGYGPYFSGYYWHYPYYYHRWRHR